MSYPHFRPATGEMVRTLTAQRDGETKLGEKVDVPAGDDLAVALVASKARFVLFGIPEDIGVRANLGVGGAHTAWEPALKALLNVQSTPKLRGDELLVLGAFDFADWMEKSLGEAPESLRGWVSRIDDVVFPLVQAIVKAGKVPLVVGGGHNNAYPLLKGCSQAMEQPLHCINLDAHSDYRRPEGRHSGNGFRYARQEGFLDRYSIIGLHENYNSSTIAGELESDDRIRISWYEDIFLRGKRSFEQAVQEALDFGKGPCGIELDLDCIEGVLSSAATPSGIAVTQARQYLSMAARPRPVYLHLTEGATELRDGRKDPTTGKLIAYLLTDFMKAFLVADS